MLHNISVAIPEIVSVSALMEKPKVEKGFSLCGFNPGVGERKR
jgi:hypothetical protein